MAAPMATAPGGTKRQASGKNWQEYVVAGGAAAVVSRTAIAPVERVKIIYQTSPHLRQGYLVLFRQVYQDGGALSFWKGNGVAVARVVPYLSVQLSANDLYKEFLAAYDVIPNKTARIWVAGVAAGATSIVSTYPLDTVRARLAVQMEAVPRGETRKRENMFRMIGTIAKAEGVPALYRGCYMSCYSGGLYSGIKFATYDYLKGSCTSLWGAKSDAELTLLQRAFSGAVGGFVAQTFVYPMDVVRRRMQTTQGPPPYRSIYHALSTIARNEGFTTGLFRGLSLNYMKTVPNVAIYLSLYDVFKYWLIEYCGGSVVPC
ncbi:Mitochondrial substrate carrier family protein B [Diplonema papillatum]|nr:Mitochondrial substrate carrier family protein B [Diplonema papillatum]